jgi:hypothetical protein
LKRAKLRALQPRAIFIEAPALPMTGRALSPDAALARIEEIRRSLLDLTSSPSLAPSPTLEEEISRIADAPFREAMAIKRERWRAKRAQERLAASARPSSGGQPETVVLPRSLRGLLADPLRVAQVATPR